MITAFMVASILGQGCITPQQAVATLTPVVVKVETKDEDSDGHGTGVYIDSAGTIVTARHVVDIPGRQVTVAGKRYYIHKAGAPWSVAIIKPVARIGAPTPHLPLNPSVHNSMGSPLFSLGFPVIMNLNYSSGYLTGFYQEEKMDVIVASIPAVPGMSGSPVLGCDGKIVGFLAAHHEASQTIALLNPVSEAIELVK